MRKTKALGVMLLSVLSASLPASISQDLDNYFTALGFAANTTAPQSYQSQMAGALTGGSLYARNRVRSSNLLTLELPRVSGGCGGIDIYTGSFSFLRGEGLKQLANDIMSAGTSYAFELALSTSIPAIAHVKDKLIFPRFIGQEIC